MPRQDRIAAISVIAAALAAGWLMHAGPASARTGSGVELALVHAEQRIATINTFAIVEKMVQSDRYKPARDAQMKDFQARMTGARGELEALVKDITTAGQDTDQGKALIQQYQVRKREAEQLDEELQMKAAELSTQQLAEAYRLVVETANAVAEKSGYTHVIATRGLATEPLQGSNLAAAVQQILARPMVRFPAGDDLTDVVAKELKVESPAAAATPPSSTDKPATQGQK